MESIPRYSADMTAAWRIVELLAPQFGEYRQGDGYFILKFGESGNHSGAKDDHCDVPLIADDDDIDIAPWSAHFHLGCMGEREGKPYPAHWEHGDRFCARGKTAMEAICLAALKAVGVEVSK